MGRNTGLPDSDLSGNQEDSYNYFITSLNISAHPLLKKAGKRKLSYFSVLEYLVNSCVLDTEYANARLLQYRSLLAGEETVTSLRKNDSANAIRTIVDDFLKPWKRGNSSILLCDIALILLHKPRVKKACGMIAKFLGKRKQAKLNELFTALYDNRPIPRMFANVENLINQFRLNRDFSARPEMRILVTANVSTGKSTLINALVGKPVTKTSQEICTKNLCFIYNKPFEDYRFHLIAPPLNLDASYDDLFSAGKEANCVIASYFRVSGHPNARVCLIDTPGFNSAVFSAHRKITRKAIAEENYDKLICVLNADKIGTNETIRHLKYIHRKVPNEKVIFVLNKLDDFRNEEDSIPESIEGVKADLRKIGYKNPVICPFSAYFSLLLKRKRNDEELSDNERDVFNYVAKKFSRPEYDLSKYYNMVFEDGIQNNDELAKLDHISGLYGLENILYGGQENEKSVH